MGLLRDLRSEIEQRGLTGEAGKADSLEAKEIVRTIQRSLLELAARLDRNRLRKLCCKRKLAIAVSRSSFYSVSVLLATFLDAQWQIWGSMVVIMALRVASVRLPLPPAIDLFRLLTTDSPLLTHAFPWSGMRMAAAFATILFCLSLKVVQLREY